MSSPRKFAEKIALLQQKQAEGDAAFNTILYEVEAAKNKNGRASTTKSKLDVPTRRYETSNGMNHSNSTEHVNQTTKFEHDNGFDQLSLPFDNASWRRTYSDSSINQSMMPTATIQHHPQHDNNDNNQQFNYHVNGNHSDPPPYSAHLLQPSNSQFQPHHHYDLNNNNYINDRSNAFYPPVSQTHMGSSPTNTSHTLLGTRYSGGNTNSNVLMLPPHQHPRSGGSLPDLRLGSDCYPNNQPPSFSSVSSPPTSASSHCFRSLSPQHNSNGDLYMLEPQQQLPSNIGPLKQSPSMRRRHSPIGDVKSSSSRRHSPTRDAPSTQPSVYRVEPQSPQSQSSYSPQNSPHLLPSPVNELSPFSPQQQQAPTENHQHYFTLSNHFDQITLDRNFFTQQPQQPSSASSSSSNPRRNHSLPTTPGGGPDFYAPFIDDIPPSYSHNQRTNACVKSPTIPNIILTDADSSKLDLSKELANDFSNSFDSLFDMPLNANDFLLNGQDPSVDPSICDDTIRMER